MDALRLIKTARHALAEARTVPDALLEAWQAGLLTEAVGARIAEREAGEVAALGQLLCDAGGHAASCVEPQPEVDPDRTVDCSDDWPADWSGGGRADRLRELGEVEPVLLALGSLLHEVAETLVVLACGAEAESVYWRCIDGVDAGAECKDLLAELLRTVRRESGAPPPTGPEEPDRDGVDVDGVDPADVDSTDVDVDGVEPDDAWDGVDALPEESGPAGGPGRGTPRLGLRAARPLPVLVVPLGPPGVAGYRPGSAAPVDPSAVRAASAARAPEDCRSASSPARSVLMDASSSCICSSRFCGAVGPVSPVGTAVAAGVCGAVGASDQGSDMRGPLQLGSAV
ncbi:DUF6099 family protein [Kitasatospora sp. NPDC088346]|uniref:DUF6099 family protein n=1 Tax=Kitasatospora sp. NPDC088346 TaxID=3364073 RepID=UPI00380E52EB